MSDFAWFRKILKLIPSLLMALGILGCTKTREAKFAFGTGEDLLLISDYDQKEFELTTEGTTESLKMTKGDKKVSEASAAQEFSVVKYSTTAELMKEAPFVGREQTKYKIKYELTDHYLKVFKIALRKDISINEQTYAEVVDKTTDLLKVPLMGYPIVSYYTITRNRNEANQETSQLIEKKAKTKTEGTHFKINKQSRELFTAMQKIDVFSASYFDGDWYYAGTVVATNYMSQDYYGYTMSRDAFGNESEKVRSKKGDGHLTFFNINVDERLIKNMADRPENQVSTVSIPAEWLDTKVVDVGFGSGLREEQQQNKDPEKSPFVKLNFKGTKSVLDANGDTTVKDIQMSDDYFSFTLINSANQAQIRHAFFRAKKRDYEKKIYLKKDEEKFGFFFNQKVRLGTPEQTSEQDFETDYFLTRFNPQLKEIDFYLSTTSPQWSESIAEIAIQEWDKVFSPIGIKLNFKKERKNLGDIRFNIINMLSQPDSDFRWGGYGPSITDPQTGEIISATANVSTTDSIYAHLFVIRRMADAQQGLLDKKYVLGDDYPSTEIFEPTTVASNQSEKIQYLKPEVGLANLERVLKLGETSNFKLRIPNPEEMVDDNKFTLRSLLRPKEIEPFGQNYKYGISDIRIKTVSENFKKRVQFAPEYDLGVTYGNVIEDINNGCPEVKKYIDNLTADSQRSSSADETKLFMPCALKVAKMSILNTLLHELGHNFGLRHNFYGSVDINDQDYSAGIRSSSVMEYVDFNSNTGHLGAYDHAAIRWAYGSELEIKQPDQTFKFEKIEPQLSIEENLLKKSAERKPYMYCSDEHVDIANYDPMCARMDKGRTPMDVIANIQQSFDSSLAINSTRLRRDRFISENQMAFYHLNKYFIPLKSFYDHWRFKLTEYAGQNRAYLESYDIPKYDALVKEMSKDPKFGSAYDKYRLASLSVVEFFTKLAFLPDRYCIIERKQFYNANEVLPGNKTEKVPFEFRLETFDFVSKAVNDSQGTLVQNCTDEAVKSVFEINDQKILGGSGYHINTVYKNSNVQDSIDTRKLFSKNRGSPLQAEINGTLLQRIFAMLMITDRFPTSYYNQYLKVYPNMMDEPRVSAYFEKTIMQRLIFGVDVTDLSNKLNVANRSLFSKNYVNEQNLLSFFFDLFKWGQYIPNNPEVNNQRFSRFKINFLYSGEILEKNELQGIKTETIELLNQTYYASEKEDIAFNLMKTMKALESMKSSVTETHPTVIELKSLMNLRLANEKTINTFTLSTFENLISAINLLGGEYIKTKNKPGLFLLKSLATPWDMFDRAVALYKKESKISDEEFAKIKQAPISNMLAEINKIIQRKNAMVKAADQAPDLTLDIFYVANFEARLGAIVEKLSQMNAVYKFDQKDYDAQFSLIMSTLIH